MINLPDTLYGLYLNADSARGLPVYVRLEAQLVAGLLVMGETRSGHVDCIVRDGSLHRLQLSRMERAPTLADWLELLEAMPYYLAVEPQERTHGSLHVLDATYRVIACLCGQPRALVSGLLHRCARCGARAVYWTREVMA